MCFCSVRVSVDARSALTLRGFYFEDEEPDEATFREDEATLSDDFLGLEDTSE